MAFFFSRIHSTSFICADHKTSNHYKHRHSCDCCQCQRRLCSNETGIRSTNSKLDQNQSEIRDLGRKYNDLKLEHATDQIDRLKRELAAQRFDREERANKDADVDKYRRKAAMLQDELVAGRMREEELVDQAERSKDRSRRRQKALDEAEDEAQLWKGIVMEDRWGRRRQRSGRW